MRVFVEALWTLPHLIFRCDQGLLSLPFNMGPITYMDMGVEYSGDARDRHTYTQPPISSSLSLPAIDAHAHTQPSISSSLSLFVSTQKYAQGRQTLE